MPRLRFALASLLCLSVAVVSAAGDGVPLRIVTLNVLEGIGATGTFARAQTGMFLTTNDLDGDGPNSGLNPDIVALQECRSAGNLLSYIDEFLPGRQMERVPFGDAGGNFQALLVRGDIEILDVDTYSIGGPRPMLRVTMRVPGAADLLTVYVAHFKAFGDAASRQQRAINARESGIEVWRDANLGLDLDDNGTRETPPGRQIFLGDLNSNNNLDGTLDGLFTSALNQEPTGLTNMPVESLRGRTLGGAPAIATYPGSGSRLDYICLDATLAARFDTNGDGVFDQDETNAAGFVYYSGDDDGAMSNGASSATSFASDHRPVVFDIVLPGEASCEGDITGDGVVSFPDLNAVLNAFGESGQGLAGDVNGDGIINFSDLNIVLNRFGAFCD